ncbi:MAG: hypothetical protein IJW73_06740 [Candidatus Gastranaerophilales bacterium]|nr:hypothetical protein [Candidatus Gastranaerophilales bacterium]
MIISFACDSKEEDINCLMFYDYLCLPRAQSFAKAFLNTFNFRSEEYKKEICEHFKINIPASDKDASSFLFDVWNYNRQHILEDENRFECRWKYFISELNDVIDDNLKQNYCNLKYGKKYKQILGGSNKRFDVESFLKEFGLEKNKKIKKTVLIQEILKTIKDLLVAFPVIILVLLLY